MNEVIFYTVNQTIGWTTFWNFKQQKTDSFKLEASMATMKSSGLPAALKVWYSWTLWWVNYHLATEIFTCTAGLPSLAAPDDFSSEIWCESKHNRHKLKQIFLIITRQLAVQIRNKHLHFPWWKCDPFIAHLADNQWPHIYRRIEDSNNKFDLKKALNHVILHAVGWQVCVDVDHTEIKQVQ